MSTRWAAPKQAHTTSMAVQDCTNSDQATTDNGVVSSNTTGMRKNAAAAWAAGPRTPAAYHSMKGDTTAVPAISAKDSTTRCIHDTKKASETPDDRCVGGSGTARSRRTMDDGSRWAGSRAQRIFDRR